MKEHYVSYDCAVKLKELGFEGNGLKNYIHQGYYLFPDGRISPIKHDFDGILVQFRKDGAEKIPAPRIDQAAKWLREVKGIAVCAFPERYNEYTDVQGIYQERLCGWDFEIWNLENEEEYDTPSIGYRESYEQALSAGLDASLELLVKDDNE